jgi:hypothetical protein
MPIPGRALIDALFGNSIPTHSATSYHLSSLHPFYFESGLIDRRGMKVPGLPYGRCGRDGSGGAYYYDEYMLYQLGLLENCNVKVLGKIGNWKSSMVKSVIYNGVHFGYNHLVIDPKGEYTRLADLLNKEIPGTARVMRFGTDTNLSINPLDPTMDDDHGTQRELMMAMVTATMGGTRRELNSPEQALLWEAMKDAKTEFQNGGVATLGDVIKRLFDPTPNMVIEMHRPADTLRDLGYHIAHGLKRMDEGGDLVGMFHRPTTPGLFDEEIPLLVMNCEGVKGEAAVLMILLIIFFTQSQWARKNAVKRFHKVIYDEAWDLAAYPEFVSSVRKAFKLGGTWGVANWIVAHHKSNFDRSGNNHAIQDLITDSETSIIFAQDANELKASQEALGLTDAEVIRIPEFSPGQALHKIGTEPGIEVHHELWEWLLDAVQTRDHLRGITDLSRAASVERQEAARSLLEVELKI